MISIVNFMIVLHFRLYRAEVNSVCVYVCVGLFLGGGDSTHFIQSQGIPSGMKCAIFFFLFFFFLGGGLFFL